MRTKKNILNLFYKYILLIRNINREMWVNNSKAIAVTIQYEALIDRCNQCEASLDIRVLEFIDKV